ncbi:carabin isoform X2 [Antechinus flavipes]|uniref:carabin isoform X2 n=1 Tax=Antechinus flavipes TaxID=38775 RepID=UPI0022364B9E|nr:carabin isoform X2 [Antechinus flavipes]
MVRGPTAGRTATASSGAMPSSRRQGEDPVPKGDPLCPPCPLLAPALWGPKPTGPKPQHLPGTGLSPGGPSVAGDHRQRPASPVPPPRNVPVPPRSWQGLLNVLKAYTLHRPEQGYCQAQGPVAAVLLMQMPPEEAFWCLVQICEFYLPGYYGPHMEAIRLDAEVFSALLSKLCPRIHKHLQQQGVGPLLYLPEWFLCLFARCLPFATVLRIWDAFFSEGVKVLFRVGLTMVRLALGTAEQRRSCPGLLETLEALRSIPPAQLQEEPFMAQVHTVAVSERDLRRESLLQLAKLQHASPELQLRPQDRLPGAPAIFEAQQLAAAKPPGREVPRIVVHPPEEPRPRKKPQTRGKTFHGILRRPRAPPTEGPSRSHRASSSFLDTRF